MICIFRSEMVSGPMVPSVVMLPIVMVPKLASERLRSSIVWLPCRRLEGVVIDVPFYLQE